MHSDCHEHLLPDFVKSVTNLQFLFKEGFGTDLILTNMNFYFELAANIFSEENKDDVFTKEVIKFPRYVY